MSKTGNSEGQFTDTGLRDYITTLRDSAKDAKKDREDQNAENYDTFFMRHDFSHKQKGQSREVLSKQRMAVAQITSFFQQALADLGEWWRVVPKNESDAGKLPLRAHEIQKLTNYMLEEANYYSHVGNLIQSGLLGSLMIAKTHGKLIPKPRFLLEKGKKGAKKVKMVDDHTWRLCMEVVPQKNFYPDPIPGRGLFIIEEMYLDLSDVIAKSKGDDAIYDAKAVSELSTAVSDEYEENYRKKNETDQNTARETSIPRVKLTEYWGDVVDRAGHVVHANAVVTVANDTTVIRKPEPNPLWHQKTPYIMTPLMEVANSVWHYALMDAPTKHSKALIELYNLIVDSAMKSVWGINQVRTDWLDDPSQISGGIPWGTSLKANSLCPPGGKVIETVITGDIPKEALSVLNIIQQELNASSLTNDLRQGVMPFRAVKATEVVEASQTITSVFNGIAKNIEVRGIQRELELAWMTVAQNLDKISKEELQSLFGTERGEQISQLSPEEVFVGTVNGVRFEVFGISLTLSKAQDFRKLTQLMQTVAGNEILLEEFMKKYDFGKFLAEIMSALDIKAEKLEIPKEEQAGPQDQELGQQVPQPNQMSQIPQAGAGALSDIFAGSAGGVPQADFPGSSATQGL